VSAMASEKTEPLYYLDATELARLIRMRVLSPVEVVGAHLDRIAAVNPKINAVVTLLAGDALKAATAAQAAVRNGAELGAFHGVPFTIKDAIDCAGIPTRAGSKLMANNVAGKDATVVTRLKRAGAIPIAKTNVPEFSGWWVTDNLVTGLTKNPWNLERTPGGSSGGEAAAIAAGMSPLGLGSDVGISVRGPAALTGIVGLKATHGRIPYTGHFPRYLSRYWLIGPMARSVRDIATAFALLDGPDGVDPYAVHAKSAEPADGPVPGTPIRVGWMAESGFGIVDREIVAGVEAVAALLKNLGCIVEPVRLPVLEQNNFAATAITLFRGEMLADFRALVAGREADLHAIGLQYAAAPDPSLAEYTAAQRLVEELKSSFAGYFRHHDVLLCPVLPLTAPPPNQKHYVVNGEKLPTFHMMRATAPFNLNGLPALAVPFCFSSERLPINVQLVAKWFDEATILRLGLLVESANQTCGRRPILEGS